MRKTLSIVLGLLMIVSLFSFGTSAAEGEAIKDSAGFAAMKEDGKYYLDADISISASYDKNFVGVLDGNGHTVTVTAPLFAEFGGTVKNLTIDGEIAATGNAGALAAKVTATYTDSFLDYALVQNVTNKAKVTLTIDPAFAPATAAERVAVGGFTGNAVEYATIRFESCVNEGDVTTLFTGETKPIENYAGGFVGRCDAMEAFECENKGNVTAENGTAVIGGFIGRASWNALTNYVNFEYCTNNGNITSGYDAGGIIGYAGLGSNICAYDMGNTPYRYFACINNGTIQGTHYCGGIVGYNYTNGGDINQTFDLEFCLNTGKIIGKQWGSNFISYSNSKFNTLCYNIGIGEFEALPDATEYFPTFLGCSSVNYADDENIHHNYVVDDAGKIKWTNWATSDSNEANRHNAQWGWDNNKWTKVTAADLATGQICYEINKAAGINGLNQTIGADATPTPSKASAFVVKDGSNYKNGTNPEFKELEAYAITDEVTTEKITKAATTKAATTAEVTTAAPGTDAPADDVTTAAPTTEPAPSGGCKSVVGIGVAVVAMLGIAYVSKKRF